MLCILVIVFGGWVWFFVVFIVGIWRLCWCKIISCCIVVMMFDYGELFYEGKVKWVFVSMDFDWVLVEFKNDVIVFNVKKKV